MNQINLKTLNFVLEHLVRTQNREHLKRPGSTGSPGYIMMKTKMLHFASLVSLQLEKTCCLPAMQKKFTEIGYTNWKKALESGRGFSKHECSDAHKEATERLIIAPGASKDIGEMISSKLTETKDTSQKILLKILQNTRYLARQALPLRGNYDEEENCDSNFHQLLLLCSENDKELISWPAKKTNCFVSPKVQNEMLEIMALEIVRDIAKSIQSADFFTILADKTGHVSNTKQ